MKNFKSKIKADLLIFCLIFFSSASLMCERQNPEIDSLINTIASRIANYPRLENYQVTVVSTAIRVDKNWKPKKTTIINKIVTVQDKQRNEKILSAIETEKGKEKDVTKKHIEEAEKRLRKSEKRKKQGKPEEKGKRFDLTQEQLLPFGVEARENYDFILKEDSEMDGRPVYVLETRAKVKSDKIFEGKYYIVKDSQDILRIQISPSKFPSVLKRFEMEADFQIIPGGYFVLKETRVKMHVGLVVKNIRLNAVEVYSDYTPLTGN